MINILAFGRPPSTPPKEEDKVKPKTHATYLIPEKHIPEVTSLIERKAQEEHKKNAMERNLNHSHITPHNFERAVINLNSYLLKIINADRKNPADPIGIFYLRERNYKGCNAPLAIFMRVVDAPTGWVELID
jgi:hypothetical protein